MQFLNDIESEEVEEELCKILQNANFKKSSSLCRMLEFIVSEAMTGRADELKAYNIAVDGLGRPATFDPQNDPAIRQLAGRLRKQLKIYYLTEGKEDSLKIDVPKGRYIPSFSRIASVDQDNLRQASPNGCALLQEDKYGHTSLVLLKMNRLGANDDLGISEILTQELLISLTRFPELWVIGPFDQCSEDLSRQCNGRCPSGSSTHFSLEGSVQKAGNMIRVLISLKETGTQRNLWAKSYTFDLRNRTALEVVLELTEKIVGRICGAHGIMCGHQIDYLPSDEQSQPYHAVLRAYKWSSDQEYSSYTEAKVSLERVIDEYPEYANAKAALADLYTCGYAYGIDSEAENLIKAERLSRAALKGDREHPNANCTAGWIQLIQGDTAKGIERVENALDLNPLDSNLAATCSLILVGCGEFTRAMQHITKAINLCATYPGWHLFIIALIHYLQKDLDSALDNISRANVPNLFWGPLLPAIIHGSRNEPEKAAPFIEKLLHLQPEFATVGRRLISSLIFVPELVDRIWADLIKAGMDAPVTST